jgi:hypothetical protein
MLLNWLVFLPLLASVLLIPRFIQSVLLLWTYSTHDQGSILVSLGNWLANPSHSLKGVTADSHTWLDEVGALLVVFGVVFSMVNRSETGKRAIDDRAFCKFVLLPVTLGAFYRVAQACSWLKDGKPPNSLNAHSVGAIAVFRPCRSGELESSPRPERSGRRRARKSEYPDRSAN